MPAIPLFCLPYAGGTAAVYREWPRLSPSWLRITPMHLPGRGRRCSEPLEPDWEALIERLLLDLEPYLDQPFALFGHSLGALIAFELAHALAQRQGVEPCWLGVAGCPAPDSHTRTNDWLTCDAQKVVDKLHAFEQTPAELLANPEFIEWILPIVRNDFHLYGSWRSRYSDPHSPLSCALHAFGGRHDPATSDPASLQAWSRETHGDFQQTSFEGGHFFINGQPQAVIDTIADAVRKHYPEHGHATKRRLFTTSHACNTHCIICPD